MYLIKIFSSMYTCGTVTVSQWNTIWKPQLQIKDFNNVINYLFDGQSVQLLFM